MMNYTFPELLGVFFIFFVLLYVVVSVFKGIFYDVMGIFSGRKNAFYHYHYHYRDHSNK